MVGEGRPVRCVGQIQRDVATGRNQFGSVKIPVIRSRIARQVAIFRHTSETAPWGSRTKRWFLAWNRASFVIAFLVLPDGLEVFDIGCVWIETQAYVMGHLGMFRLDLHRRDPRILR